ncbi:Glycoside hydrolase family 16 protein [Mycena venus]|uniref:Glycoside hydrolase family 16 protein n=1 Tax=Mycena venus TaxID=2733690 RepID=A0A8H7D2H3_9AGAR|nr:Glycoside hydrolase family 16 protein [Mycena venus]
MYITILLALFLLLRLNFALSYIARDTCQPYHATFNDSEAAAHAFYSRFIPVSPENSYALTENGLEMYLRKPEGRVTKSDGVNKELGSGATINSTFILYKGKVTFEVESPSIAGVIVAGILIGDTSFDEIDIEFVCGEPDHWQTNLFRSRSTQVSAGVQCLQFKGEGG